MLDFARLVRLVPVADSIARYAVQLVQASRPGSDTAPDFVKSWVSWGAGTRGAQGLLLGAKARALLQGRHHVSFGDIRAIAPDVLCHRILTNFRAEADHVKADDIVARLLETVQPPEANL
jgi:MoxR-like ATPase